MLNALYIFSGIPKIQQNVGKFIRISGFMIRLAMFAAEMFIYRKLYKTIWKNDLKIEKSLPPKSVKHRKTKNAISLKAQMSAFLVEMIFLSVLLLSSFLHIKEYFLVIIGLFQNALSNLTIFMSSPELRRNYFGKDDVWLPNWRKK